MDVPGFLLVPDARDRLNLFLARYQVGLAGGYQEMDHLAEPFGCGTVFCHTCFILEVNDRWYLATAGHILDDLDRKSRAGDAIEGLRLVTLTREPESIAFDFWASKRHHIVTVLEGMPCKNSSSALDIGLVAIPQETREALECAGIKRAPFRETFDTNDYSGFVILGLPTELFGPVESDENHIRREVNPTIVSFNVLPGQEQRPKDHLLVGSFPAEMSVDAHGLSGGLIFGFHFDPDPRKVRFEAVAVQSHWCPKYRRAYGCPIGLFVERVNQQFC